MATLAKALTDEQALEAWRTHNPFQRAPPELIKRIKLITKPTIAEDAPY